MKLEFKIDGFTGEIGRNLAANVQKAGFYGVSKLRGYLNAAQPYDRSAGQRGVHYRGRNPSSPGQFPKKLSGQLMKSVTFNATAESLTIGSSIGQPPYPKFLQLGTKYTQARPWLTLFFDAEREQLARIILGGS